MPFVTKKPSHYFSALEEESTDPLHVGLYLAGNITDERANDLVKLGRSICQSSRPIRCLWLRFKEGDESLLDAFRSFGRELAGATTIQSLVFEGRVGITEVECLREYFNQTDLPLRGLQFRRTDVDVSTFILLQPFFTNSTSLKVLDMSSNPSVGDDCINIALDALLEGGSQLETLNIGEQDLDGQPDGNNRISGDGVAAIASFVSKTPSLSSITLRLRNLDDVGIGEMALVCRTSDCSVRRLDLSGNFGNSGIKIFAEALKTNTSLRTISFGCHKALNDIGAKVLLNVVDPFSFPPTDMSSEWDNIQRSNHTLQSIYILDRPTVSVDKALITKLQSISTQEPHRTLRKKCWHHLEENIETISHLGLEPKQMPEVLAFVHQHGSMDHLFRLVKSRNTPELFSNPSPEKARLSSQMAKMERENESLRTLLESERERAEDVKEENNYLKHLLRNKEEAKKCCLLPVFKMMELWKIFIELLKDPVLS